MTKIVTALIVLSLLPNIAWGYIDPGSGSAIMSAIIGFFVAIGLAIKTYWYKIKSLFIKKESDKEKSLDEE